MTASKVEKRTIKRATFVEVPTVRILCIEENSAFAAIVKSGLQHACFTVDHFANAEDGLQAIANVNYDAAILDLNLLDLDSLTLLKRMRATRNAVPVLVLSARNKAAERIAGLEAGVDDYLPKPFEMAELVARVRALLRRSSGTMPVELTCGNLAYWPDTHIAVVAGQEHRLARRGATLLEHLLRNAGQPVSRSAIEDRLYAFGEEVASNAVDVHIHYLRKRLAAMEANVSIMTIRGTGYVLSAGGADKAAQRPKSTGMSPQRD